jgi:hypothetical protein
MAYPVTLIVKRTKTIRRSLFYIKISIDYQAISMSQVLKHFLVPSPAEYLVHLDTTKCRKARELECI